MPDAEGGIVPLSCLVAREIHAPADVTPIEWRLLTSREVSDLAAAAQLIDWYRVRWEMEIFFHVLKNGCRVDALQLSTIERALAGFMIVAWCIAHLMRLGRSCLGLDAGLLFEPDEWKAAFILNKKAPPDKPLRLNEVVRLVAMPGGFLARKGDGEPGVKTIWQACSESWTSLLASDMCARPGIRLVCNGMRYRLSRNGGAGCGLAAFWA